MRVFAVNKKIKNHEVSEKGVGEQEIQFIYALLQVHTCTIIIKNTSLGHSALTVLYI